MPEHRFLPQFPPLNDPQSPSPYAFDDVQLRIYPIEAQAAPLTQLCQYFLNGIAEGAGLEERWLPLTGSGGEVLVYLQVVKYGKMYSLAPGYPQLGYSTQSEMLFLVPVVRVDGSGDPEAVETFVPYCVVDNDWSLISGREVVGYPKVYGRFDLPDDLAASDQSISVSARAIRSAGGELEMLPVLGIPPAEPGPGVVYDEPQKLWPFGPLETLFGRGGTVPLVDPVYDLIGQLTGVKQPGVALKQTRDAASTSLADLQALVGFDTVLVEFSDSGSLPETPIQLAEDYASLPLRQALGLPATGDLQPVDPVYYKADFKLVDARNLVVNCGGSTVGVEPPKSCIEIYREGFELCLQEATTQVEQCRHAWQEIAAGRYTPADAMRDYQEGWLRTFKLWAELGQLSTRGWVSCLGEMPMLPLRPAGSSDSRRGC